MATGKDLTSTFHTVKADEYMSENMYSNLDIHFPNAFFVDMNFSLTWRWFATEQVHYTRFKSAVENVNTTNIG